MTSLSGSCQSRRCLRPCVSVCWSTGSCWSAVTGDALLKESCQAGQEAVSAEADLEAAAWGRARLESWHRRLDRERQPARRIIFASLAAESHVAADLAFGGVRCRRSLTESGNYGVFLRTRSTCIWPTGC